MNPTTPFARYLARFPKTAAIAYVVAVIALLLVAWSAVADVFDRQAAVAAATAVLEQLEGRGSARTSPTGTSDTAPSGSPFLEGPTVTVAGAALLARIASAVTRAGGNVLSSQVDLQGPQSKAGFLSVTASCEIDQPALQQLLYDLEAGMPFLFVDQLVVQAPAVSSGSEDRRMRVVLGVSGQWRGAK